MARALENSETQADGVWGAECSALPDGSQAIAAQTGRGGFLCRAWLSQPGRAAAVLVGPPPFADLFRELAWRLTAQGASCVIAHPSALVDASGALAATAALLRERGARRLALIGASSACTAALERARGLDAEVVLLLSPDELPEPRAAGLLGGRPVIVCSGEEHACARRLGPLPHATLLEFPGAGATFAEVHGDLLASCLPPVLSALACGPDARSA